MMELDNILKRHPKLVRKLKYLWPLLTKQENFIIPKTIDEIKQLGGPFATKIILASTEDIFNERMKGDYVTPYYADQVTELYFNKKSKAALSEFLNTLYNIPEIKNSVSYYFICKTTLSFIERAIYNNIHHSIKPDTAKDIENIIGSLIQGQKHFQFFRVVEGVELKGTKSLTLGDVELFVFSETNEREIRQICEYTNENGYYQATFVPFVEEHFFGKECLRTVAFGDEIMAAKIAAKKMRHAINILRFIVCLLDYERIHENLIKINLIGESYNVIEDTIHIDLDNKILTRSYGKGRTPLQKLPVNNKLLINLKEIYFFNDLLFILTKENKTELENAILTSIYWIGEAQDDYVYESAFIKYWTALETLITLRNEGITENLAKSIPTLLAFGGYKVIEIGEIEEARKSVVKLYDKRSDIIHRGIYGDVSPVELTEVCKYAVWCVQACLGLRLRYETLEQIRNETNRLYDLSTRGSLI